MSGGHAQFRKLFEKGDAVVVDSGCEQKTDFFFIFVLQCEVLFAKLMQQGGGCDLLCCRHVDQILACIIYCVSLSSPEHPPLTFKKVREAFRTAKVKLIFFGVGKPPFF